MKKSIADKWISRAKVIEAIRTEPLIQGTFVETALNKYRYCEVCAVGAVLRKAGLTNKKISLFGECMLDFAIVTPSYEDDFGIDTVDIIKLKTNRTIQDYLKNKMYLHALSMKFESYSKSNYNTKRARENLIKFVKANFPPRIQINPRN